MLLVYACMHLRPCTMQVDEDKEARKLEAARAVLAGRSFTEGEEDPFEGLGPQEIQAYIDKALQGVSHSDPFEVGVLHCHGCYWGTYGIYITAGMQIL